MRIAYLTNELVTSNPQRMWKGVVDAARAHHVDLITLVGSTLPVDSDRRSPPNILYELVRQAHVDGLLVRGYLSSGLDTEAEMNFYHQFAALPCVIIGRKIRAIPHLLMDSYSGMRDAIVHLIETHGCRRIAFVRGPEFYDAEERLRAYVEALSDYRIPYDPDLVTPPLQTWTFDKQRSIQWLLNRERLDFDAIVTASDGLALDTLHTLTARGKRVPEDLILVGFDNSGTSPLPLLTSVDGGFYEQGKRGFEMLLGLLEGRPVPQQILLPTRLVVRQSCGCLDLEVVRAAATPADSSTANIAYPLDELAVNAHDQSERTLWASLAAELNDETAGIFLRTLASMLRTAASAGDEMEVWHSRVSSLRQNVLTRVHDLPKLSRAENLLQQARVLVSQAAVWEEANKRLKAQQRTDLVYEISQALVTTFDNTELMKVLARELPRLDIPRAYLCLYEDPERPLDCVRLAMAYDGNGRSEKQALPPVFPSAQLLPQNLLPAESPYSLVVESLHFHAEQLGLAIFEVGPRDGHVYDMLRGQISSALKGAQLFRQNSQLYQEARESQRAAEEANRLKSRFLASVSHELRTPLNMLIGLSEMLLDEQNGGRPPLPTLYRQDLERIYGSARHLDDLLRDVLDLARSQVGRLKLVRKPVDLMEVLYAVSAVVEPIVIQKGLEWQVTIPETHIAVWGDAARLKQVLLNLIHNAIKFTARGEIAMSAIIGKGEVTISISDTGLGIPPEEQDIIFDEFQTTQRSAARGYGGMGLGLAICRRLVEMHNGRMGVRSSGEEGSGSTFYFTLPTMSHYRVQEASPESVPRQTVLLITDQHRPERHLETHLVREGFEIETLEVEPGTAEWLPAALDKPPALIILDMQIEAPQSQELVRLIKEHPAAQDIPVMFYSLLQEQNSGALMLLDYLVKPVDAAALSRALARYDLADHQHPRTILIVDDDRQTLDMNLRAVQAQLPGCHVLEASDGRTALELMQQWRPDLVLLDLVMPGFDGFDVLLAMQEHEITRGIPAIVLTGLSLTEADMSRMSQGVALVLSKGVFSVEETLAHIESALARNRHLGSEAQRVVRKVMAYIHEHYMEPIGRGDMAAHAGVSERHLDRCFQQDMGITPVSYLNRYRVREARTLLSLTDKSVTEIALAVGFSSSTHFGRVFRREVGLSPSAFQRGEQSS